MLFKVNILKEREVEDQKQSEAYEKLPGQGCQKRCDEGSQVTHMPGMDCEQTTERNLKPYTFIWCENGNGKNLYIYKCNWLD